MNPAAPPFGLEPAPGAPATLRVHGTLSFATATQALHALQSALTTTSVGTLDLSGVTQGDSAGLACLLAALGEASRHGRPLQLTHLPEGMRTLAGVCGVDRLLG